MDTNQLHQAVMIGREPIVTFGAKINDQLTCIDAGMRGRITHVEKVEDGNFVIKVDLSQFQAHNHPLERKRYPAIYGRSLLSAREAGLFKNKESFRLCEGEIDLFTIDSKQ